MRRTIARSAELAGAGLHTGATVRLTLRPAASGTGVRFRRCDLPGAPAIAATLDHVVATERRTALGVAGATVETVEHLLAAVHASGLDDLEIEMQGPEVPILDGSFAPFVALLADAGSHGMPGSRTRVTVAEAFDLTEGESRYRVTPAEESAVEVHLSFAAPVIGAQSAASAIAAEPFRRELAAARTFGFVTEGAALLARGLAAGGSSACAILLSEVAVLNTTLRWPNEFARHKAGDLVGDLALLGAPLALHVAASRPSHRGNIACARAIAARARFQEVS